jgi:hypothetical protein
MTGRTASVRKLTLTDVQCAFTCWRGSSGLYRAHPSDPGSGELAPVKAEDPPGLLDAIILHQAQRRDAIIEAIITLLFSPSFTGTSSPPSGGLRPVARSAC